MAAAFDAMLSLRDHCGFFKSGGGDQERGAKAQRSGVLLQDTQIQRALSSSLVFALKFAGAVGLTAGFASSEPKTCRRNGIVKMLPNPKQWGKEL